MPPLRYSVYILFLYFGAKLVVTYLVYRQTDITADSYCVCRASSMLLSGVSLSILAECQTCQPPHTGMIIRSMPHPTPPSLPGEQAFLSCRHSRCRSGMVPPQAMGCKQYPIIGSIHLVNAGTVIIQQHPAKLFGTNGIRGNTIAKRKFHRVSSCVFGDPLENVIDNALRLRSCS